MILIRGNEEKLKNSPFYDEDCWDFPIEERKYLENKNEGIVYILGNDNRIYETHCTFEDFSTNLYKKEFENIILNKEERKNVKNQSKNN